MPGIDVKKVAASHWDVVLGSASNPTVLTLLGAIPGVKLSVLSEEARASALLAEVRSLRKAIARQNIQAPIANSCSSRELIFKWHSLRSPAAAFDISSNDRNTTIRVTISLPHVVSLRHSNNLSPNGIAMTTVGPKKLPFGTTHRPIFAISCFKRAVDLDWKAAQLRDIRNVVLLQ